jgi:tRNA A37 N6-isopentenylltransferase MiaA
MGRTKDFLGSLDLTEEELNEELYSRGDEDYQYQKWIESKEFAEYVNGEIDSSRPIYSEHDIMSATRYASKQITLEPSEIGKEVYDMLFSEKIEEYLSIGRHGL